jgi:hypothetical protein
VDADTAPFVLAQGCHWSHVLAANDQLDALPLMDDKKKERRKKFLKRLVQAILAYEALPEAVDSHSLGDNTTYATKLVIPGVLEGQPLRVRVAQRLLPPSTTINFFSKVVHPDVKATNGENISSPSTLATDFSFIRSVGIIHVVNRPVLPPLSAFQTLFLLPGQFSIFVGVSSKTLPPVRVDSLL